MDLLSSERSIIVVQTPAEEEAQKEGRMDTVALLSPMLSALVL